MSVLYPYYKRVGQPENKGTIEYVKDAFNVGSYVWNVVYEKISTVDNLFKK